MPSDVCENDSLCYLLRGTETFSFVRLHSETPWELELPKISFVYCTYLKKCNDLQIFICDQYLLWLIPEFWTIMDTNMSVVLSGISQSSGIRHRLSTVIEVLFFSSLVVIFCPQFNFQLSLTFFLHHKSDIKQFNNVLLTWM